MTELNKFQYNFERGILFSTFPDLYVLYKEYAEEMHFKVFYSLLTSRNFIRCKS